jgi:16S rRNA processing protein RimM
MGKLTSGYVVLGRISGIFGTRGWLKVYSYTRPRDGIFSYPVWNLSGLDGWHPFKLAEGKPQGNGLIAALAGIEDRNAAVNWVDSEIAVPRSELPARSDGEYYWADLIGAAVVTKDGISLGQVVHLVDTGAHDVLVVSGDRERLIPFVSGHYILDVDLVHARVVVDWHIDD